MVDTKTGSGIVALPEHMTTNILFDENPFGALMKATTIHKSKGRPQWHSVAEIEATPPPSNSDLSLADKERIAHEYLAMCGKVPDNSVREAVEALEEIASITEMQSRAAPTRAQDMAKKALDALSSSEVKP